ncbi:hypothetical protein N3K66_004576 [Trichothecium roseum]|uniref:Uncharacterized protein n=1 Tax=Trichothecium roseum TaxID=47278 RepID=A0ACC0V1P2_9HYPO|nr:hypothetical protein N3K66_004576 [Trichothecium roseum]
MLNQLQGRFGRRYIAVFAFIVIALFLWNGLSPNSYFNRPSGPRVIDSFKYVPSSVDWSQATVYHPLESIQSPPSGSPKQFPTVQARPSSSEEEKDSITEARKQAIKAKFVKSWEAYKKNAWTKDELMPMSGKGKQTLSGWGAQVVDALDTLWIMGLKDEFRLAVKEVAVIDWSKTTDNSINLFEVTIRYLGGLLAAYDLSGEDALLVKATELADMLYVTFDTPNHMPSHWFSYEKAQKGEQEADIRMSGAAGGSLCLEMTRLSQLTGNPKYYDATERIKQFFYKIQNDTAVPGLWPNEMNYRDLTLIDSVYTLGAGSDSQYEYLPKMHAILGGLDPQYEEMTAVALDTARDNLLFRPMTPDDANILMAGNGDIKQGRVELSPHMEHLSCFIGGTYGLAGRLLDRDDYVDLAARLTNGCVWAYDSFATNIMPEASLLVACQNMAGPCAYSEDEMPPTRQKNIPDGFVRVRDPRYLLRPEAIESVFYMWRITGNQSWRDAAWRMWQGIVKETETEMAFASINDVKVHSSDKVDSMETFWMGETLKYFYLIFEDESVVNLDEWVFNTEAHPLKRPS